MSNESPSPPPRRGRLARAYHEVLDVIRAFVNVAFTIRFSIAMSLLAGIAVSLPDQALEALRVLATQTANAWTGERDGTYLPLILFTLSALALSLLSWYCARVVLYLIDPLPQSKGLEDRAKMFWRRHLPRVVGALPLLFIAVGMWRADDHFAVESRAHSLILDVLAWASILLAILLYAFFHLRAWLFGTGRPVQPETTGETFRIGSLRLARSSRAVLLLAVGTVVLWVVLILFFTNQTGRVKAGNYAGAFGPMGLVLLFAAIWIPIGTALVYAGKRLRLPLFLLLVAWAFFWSILDTNDNHRIRYASKLHHPEQGARSGELLTVNEGFRRWLEARCDKDAYRDSGYPVYIVSAEGGGIRAAYFASVVLSALQDEDPAFMHHVFAYSGVSGGSLGGAVYAGLAHKYTKTVAGTPCAYEYVPPKSPYDDTRPATMVEMTDKVLGEDLLSPTLASALYPDLLQRFLPFAVDRFDRARALEDALGEAWYGATGTDEFRWPGGLGFYDLGKDFGRNSVPALFLNTTRVETGERMVVSTLDPRDPDPAMNERYNDLVSLHRMDRTLSMPLNTAAVLSARFPVITPAGYLEVEGKSGEPHKQRYVDGGYFENSGTATVLDLLTGGRLVETALAAGVKVRLIVIRIGTDPGELSYKRQGLGEITSPIFTLLNTRNARGTLATRHLRTRAAEFRDLQATLAPGGAAASGANAPGTTTPLPPTTQFMAETVHFQVNESKTVKLPLGWLLSKEARQEMKCQITDPARPLKWQEPWKCEPGRENVESFKAVSDALKARATTPAAPAR